MKGDIDYRYSLDLFRRIEKLTLEGKPLPEYFTREDCDYWQFYKQRAFEEIKAFSRTQKMESSKQSLRNRGKDFLINTFILASTLACFLKRRDVLIYAIDKTDPVHQSDFRISALYEGVKEGNVSYAEIFHTVATGQTLKNFWTRKRLTMYLESADVLYHMAVFFRIRTPQPLPEIGAATGAFTSDEEAFVRKIVCKYVAQIDVSQFKIMLFARMMRSLQCKAFFTIDDARYYYELLIAAKSSGIPSYAIQHGHFTKYHVGWLKNNGQDMTIGPDYFLVWNEYWKNELIRLGGAVRPESILVAGEKDLKQTVVHDTRNPDTVTILIPYETACPKFEVAEYIHRFLALNDVRVIFKLRPDISPEVQLAEYGLHTLSHPHFKATHTLDDLGAVDIVAGVYSTFLYDMIPFARIIILETSSDYGEGMYLNGLADLLHKTDDLHSFLWSVKKNSDSHKMRYAQTFSGAGLLRDALNTIVSKYATFR